MPTVVDLRRLIPGRRSEETTPPRPARPAAPPAPTPLFVVTYGRSGSTLVQGILNALPRTLVRGENGFFVLELFRATARATAFADNHRKHGARNTTSAFFGVHGLRRNVFVTQLRRLMLKTLLAEQDASGVDRLGFKEVLWHEIEPEETEAFFDWFERVFPDARYLLHTRDREALPSSGFWRFEDADSVYAKVDRTVEIQGYLATTRPERVLATSYERLTDPERRDEELRAIATFATGGCDDEQVAALREVLDMRHGPWGRPGKVPPDPARARGEGHG
jgi:hypothetical protein